MRKTTSNYTTSNYTVGYGRPPKHHQFKPGQSGNPTGRPKGVRNFSTDLRDELDEPISIKDGDNNSVEVTRQRAIVKVLVKAALEGDFRAATTVLSLSSRAFGSEAEPEFDPADQAIAELSQERQRKRADAIATGKKI
jgi:Family of unknown function (DUF5681)